MKITPNILRVFRKFRQDIGYVNTYVILDDVIAVIDAGMKKAPKSEIIKAIKDSGRNPRELEYIILTHEHLDNIGSAKWLKEKTGADVYINANAEEQLKDPRVVLSKNFGLDKREQFLLKLGTLEVDIPKLDDFKVLKNGDIFNLGENKLLSIETAGHSGAHFCFWNKNSGILFAGDEITVYPGNYFKQLVDLTGSVRKREESLLLFLEMSPELILTTHDEVYFSEDTIEILETLIDVHEMWINTIMDILHSKNRPMTTLEINRNVQSALGTLWNGDMAIMENSCTVKAYLEYLKEEGKVEKVPGKGKKHVEEKWIAAHA
ncbi:MAG: MBL fold metallo-hydrolase [Candidatus Odinarchaeia archaeon]